MNYENTFLPSFLIGNSGFRNLKVEHKIRIPLVGLLCIGLFSCSKNEISEASLKEIVIKENKVENRNINDIPMFVQCQPGTLNVENGILRFPTFEDYIQTLDFLNCADSIAIENWRNSFDLMTLEKYFLNFRNELMSVEGLDDSTFYGLLEEYDGKIKILEGQDNEYYFDYLVSSLPEFLNLDGVFRIGSTIEKHTDSLNITITDGDWNKLQQAILSKQSDLEEGILVFPRQDDFTCCPGNDMKETHEFGGRYVNQLTWWSNLSTWRRVGQEYWVLPYFRYRSTQEAFKRGAFNRWVGDRKHHDVDHDIVWAIKLGAWRDWPKFYKKYHVVSDYEFRHDLTFNERQTVWFGPFDEPTAMICLMSTIQTAKILYPGGISTNKLTCYEELPR